MILIIIIIINKICPNWIILPSPNYTVTKYPENPFCNVIIFNCANPGGLDVRRLCERPEPETVPEYFSSHPQKSQWLSHFRHVLCKSPWRCYISWCVSSVTLLDQLDHKIGDDSITQLSGLETCRVTEKYHQSFNAFNYFQCLHC